MVNMSRPLKLSDDRLLPADDNELDRALRKLRVSALLEGFRGAGQVDRTVLLAALQKLAALTTDGAEQVRELEINPLFVDANGACAVDVLMQVCPS